MSKPTEITIRSKYISNYNNGYPLISKEYIELDRPLQEGTIVHLVDNRKKFIAKGYYGVQNKGYGWILSRNQNQSIDKTFFQNKIKEAIAYRKSFFDDTTTTAFRIFNGEGDGVGGLTIDYFDGYYLFTWYSVGIYSFRDIIIDALKSEVGYKGIYQKRRFDAKGQYLDSADDFILGEKAPEPLIIKENSLKFAIYLDDGAMVGLFLDQKEVRKTIREKYAKGKSMLNTFSYTGAFSIAGAVGGAIKTTSVDLAKRSLPKTKEQFEINSIDISSQDIIVEDIFNYFKYAIKKNIKFDIVVLDPPSFARTKKYTFSVAKDYVKLIKEAIEVTHNGGVIVASTNYSNFDMNKFKMFVEKAFSSLDVKYKIEESFSLPKDFRVLDKFRESNYLKVLFIRKV
ncbi:MAG: class I SAM-dependent rRNA methyltransferase [Sulfurovum sp.]